MIIPERSHHPLQELVPICLADGQSHWQRSHSSWMRSPLCHPNRRNFCSFARAIDVIVSESFGR